MSKGAEGPTTEKKLDWLIDMQKNESNLHWTRNSYFTVTASILLLALSQFKGMVLGEIISVVGIIFSIAWLAIQHRSNAYIAYYKNKIRELDPSSDVVFPLDIPGYQMRKVAFLLPIAFLLMWFVILGAVVSGIAP